MNRPVAGIDARPDHGRVAEGVGHDARVDRVLARRGHVLHRTERATGVDPARADDRLAARVSLPDDRGVARGIHGNLRAGALARCG
jgi:hypothetical protein